MPRTIDLSGTPFDEPCAQIGRDPDASVRSRQEALAYRAALVAVLGVPPDGYALEVASNAHDFGTYYTVRLRCPSDAVHYDAAYEAVAENGALARGDDAGTVRLCARQDMDSDLPAFTVARSDRARTDHEPPRSRRHLCFGSVRPDPYQFARRVS